MVGVREGGARWSFEALASGSEGSAARVIAGGSFGEEYRDKWLGRYIVRTSAYYIDLLWVISQNITKTRIRREVFP